MFFANWDSKFNEMEKNMDYRYWMNERLDEQAMNSSRLDEHQPLPALPLIAWYGVSLAVVIFCIYL